MQFKQIFVSAALVTLASAQAKGGNNNANAGNANAGAAAAAGGNGATGTTLLANAIQSGSATDGSVGGVSAAGQSKSATSTNNFINFCSGKTVTNGLQVQGGSCNGIVMGDIPAKGSMVSGVITFPQTGGQGPAANTDFDIKVQINNLVAGSFTNADNTYYSAPQALQGGKVVGHTHVTVQDMGNTLNPTKALDATQFAFFKGINDAGDGKGGLSATVTGGLPAGNYRVCTMTSSSNHQPVLMPVAQRGTPDDCTKFTVGGAAAGGAANANAGGAANANAGKAATGGQAANANAAAGGAKAAATSAAATKANGANNAAATKAAAGGQGQGAAAGGFGGGKGFGQGGKGRFRRNPREFIA